MNKKLWALAVPILMIALPTQAANWVFVAANTRGDALFIDKSSLQKDGDSVTFWAKANYTERTVSGDLSDKVQFTFNCRRRERIIRYMMFYDDKDNKGRLTYRGHANDNWDPISPETLHWEAMVFVCRK